MLKNISLIARNTWMLVTFLIISCDNTKDAHPINVIPLASAVGKYNILNLSDYVSEIKYIPLETNDSVLIGEIRQINYENEKILIGDHTGNCYLFNNNGKFIRKIGKRGQGPNEYLFLNQAIIHENLIYLKDAVKMLIYDFNGSLVDNINLRSNGIPAEYRCLKILPLKNNTFIMDVAIMGNGYYPKALLFETYQSKVKIINEYPNHIKLDKSYSFFSSLETAIMYRFNDGIRTYKSINDTIFTINHNMEIKDAFIFDLGKYRPSLSFLEGKESYNGDFITPRNIFESHNRLFLEFGFHNFAPEAFERPSEIGSVIPIWTIDYVFSVFDKLSGKLSLMKQPIKEKLGFKNDIDNGPVIWPHYLSSNNEFVTYISVEEFMDYYVKIEKPNSQMTIIAQIISCDDNQIVIIAKLR